MVMVLASGLFACAPAVTSGAAAGPNIVATRDGADVVIPNPGEALQDHWALTLDVSPDWATNEDGMKWCPKATREMRTSPSLGAFLRYSCDMPALGKDAQRRLRTIAGKILDYQGSGYRASSGDKIVTIGPPKAP